MPRDGRAALQMVSPDRVRAAFKKHYGFMGIAKPSPSKVALAWDVSERTVRRWQKTGLPLHYGYGAATCVTRDEWDEFERTGVTPAAQRAPARERTGSRDRANLSATPARRTGVDRKRRKT